MLNNITLVGRLTADPELRTTPNGVPVCSFNIAVDRPFKSKDGEKQTDFFTVIAWRHSAELVSVHFTKGMAIGVIGAMQTRKYTTKDGDKRTAYEVVADHVSFVERKQAAVSAYQSGEDADFSIINDDDVLPF